MERSGSPSLLPILRSRQQGEVLAALLERPEREWPLAELSRWLDIPKPSVHREIERAEQAGIVASRKVGRTRVVRANPDSPYYGALRELLTRAFGPPTRIGAALGRLPGIDAAYIFGSWAAAWEGDQGPRPVGDIDLLVLGDPERNRLYRAMEQVGRDLGREVQVQIRPPGWLESGKGSFHTTITAKPMVQIYPDTSATKVEASDTARSAN